MKNVRKNIGAQALMAFVVIIGLYFGYNFAREVVQAERLTRQEDSATAINAQIDAENRKLERELAYYNSDEYVKLRANTDLNLTLPDEQIILPVMPKDEQAQEAVAPVAITTPDASASIASLDPSNTPAPAGADTSNTPNWDRWLQLFAH